MTAVVTGATSFIGTALCRFLVQQGHEVYAVVRPDSPNLANLNKCDGIHILYTDLANMESITRSVTATDLFFHLAWEGVAAAGRNDVGIQAQNITHSLSAIDIAHRLHCKCFVMFGSQAEYGRVEGIIEETAPCDPETAYGKAKLELYFRGSEQCKELGMKYLHLRIFSIYGVGDHPWTLISSLIARLSKNEDMALSSCLQKWNFLYIDDAAKQIADLAVWAMNNDTFSSDIFNIASGDTRVLRDFVEEARALVGGTGRPLYGQMDSSRTVSIEPSVKKLRKTIGFVGNISFREGIKCIVKSL